MPNPTCDCGTCRKCKHRVYMRGWYERNPDKKAKSWAALKAHNQAKRDADPDEARRVHREHQRRYRAANPEAFRAAKARYRERHPDANLAHPERRSARGAVAKALHRGEIVRPDSCERCGSPATAIPDGRSALHAHHDDYSKPLEVHWLCLACHGETLRA